MADYNALVEGFKGGADWRQKYRANKQLEKARDLAIEDGTYDMEARRANRRIRDPATTGVLGDLDPNSVQDWSGGLQDPFATRLSTWFKTRKSRKAAQRQAIPVGGGGAMPAAPFNDVEARSSPLGELGSISNPDDAGLPVDPSEDVPGSTMFADGGAITEKEAADLAERMNAQQLRNARIELAKDAIRKIPGKVRDAASSADGALGKFTGRAAEGSGFLKRAVAGVKRAGAAGALAGTAITAANTPTEDYRERFGLETDDPSLAGDIGVRALGAASDLGSVLSFGAADRLYRDKQRKAEEAGQAGAAAPAPAQAMDLGGEQGAQGIDMSTISRSRGGQRSSPVTAEQPQPVDFSDVDIDPKEVPDMKTDDWVKYRAQVMDAARRSGDVKALKEAGDMVTQMQQQGFLNYGQQGFALQQAGNIRGAMAAYRAAFQYFPNGNDVEFGVHRGRDGRQQIVGVGLDEKTGKRVPGSEMIMDPERVGVLLENFKNPAAFRMWTKDHRDDQFREREYQEVKKPLAQATVDYQANNSEANILRAENAQLRTGGVGGSGAAANMRTAERTFRERLGQMGMTDEPTADFLASVMSQVKAANPSVPDNVIIQTIMTAQRDGSLQKRLAAMRGPRGAMAPAPEQPRQAIPTDGPDAEQDADADDPAFAGLSPEEIEWAKRPAQ